MTREQQVPLTHHLIIYLKMARQSNTWYCITTSDEDDSVNMSVNEETEKWQGDKVQQDAPV